MTYARKALVSLNDTAYYHVVARCVRRAWLWGYDKYADRDFSHRKAWVLERLTLLASMFADRGRQVRAYQRRAPAHPAPLAYRGDGVGACNAAAWERIRSCAGSCWTAAPACTDTASVVDPRTGLVAAALWDAGGAE
jgi:hypothetical protein